MIARKVTCLLVIVIVVGSAVLSGCAKAPTVQVWRPWTRLLGDENALPPGSVVRVSIEGISEPLLGEESLLQSNLQEFLEALMVRRGYILRQDGAEYSLVLRYRTIRRDKLYSSSIAYAESRSSMVAVAGTKQSSTLAVTIAGILAGMTAESRSKKFETTETLEFYTHTLSLEVLSRRDVLLWKGEATWDSRLVDATSAFPPALHLLVASLPAATDCWPELPKVRSDRVENFFRLECQGHWFSSPALPYRVSFAPLEQFTGQGVRIPRGVKDRQAFAAYVDLLQTAEHALPQGSDSFEDPLDRSLWKKVRLGHRYVLGSDTKATPILITLTGSTGGYEVDKCWIADEEEYEEFTKKLDDWRQALLDYYNVYEE